MDSALLNKIFTKKTKDYGFMIVFFLIFSFFVLFVIRPNLTTVFNLQRERDQLTQLDQDYERAIFNIVSIQSSLERNRESFPLLNDAVPSAAQVNRVIDDITKIASSSSFDIKKIDINQISLKESTDKNETHSYQVFLESAADFNTTRRFINDLLKQRRLKTLKTLNLEQDNKESTQSSFLRIKLEIEGHYL